MKNRFMTILQREPALFSDPCRSDCFRERLQDTEFGAAARALVDPDLPAMHIDRPFHDR
jgi:hypothetical protein